MKKYIFIIMVFLIMVVSVSAKNIDNELDINNLNSKNLLQYLEKKKVKNRTIRVCNTDYCDYLKYKDLRKSVNKYIDDYIIYVEEKTDVDTSVRVSLKGFLITEISYS